MRNWLAAGGFAAATVAIATVLGTMVLVELPIDSGVLLLAGCGTLLVYQIDRSWLRSPEDRVNAPDRAHWLVMRRLPVAVLGAAAFAGAVLGATQVPREALIVAAGLGVLGLLHAVPLAGRRLKSAGILKPWLIGAVWGFGSVGFPAMAAQGLLAFGPFVLGLIVYRALIVAANVLLSDLADAEGDRQAGLYTLSTRWPEGRVRRLSASIALGAWMLIMVTGWVFHNEQAVLLATDSVGPLLLAGAAMLGGRFSLLRDPLVLDAIVAWPVVTFTVAMML